MGTRTWAGLAIIMSLWATNLAVAADWSLVPAVNLKTEYNSNINTTSGGSTGSAGQLSDFIFTLNPSAAFIYATEASKLQGNIGISQLLYVKNTEYNHTDQNYQINGQYSLTPRFNISLTSSFISDSTAQQELLASGLSITRVPRLALAVGPGISYNLTERLSASLNYNFNKVTYQPVQTTQSQNSQNSQNYQNYSSQAVSLMWQYLLSEKTTVSNTFSGTETTYTGTNANDYKSLLVSLGVNHKFSERWQFNAAGGVNYSSYTNNSQISSAGQFPNFVSVPTQKQKGTNFSPYFNLGATRQWTNLSITGSFSRNQQASAYGYISQVNALSLAINYQFTQRLSGSLGGSYSLSSQSSNTTQNQNNYYTVGPQLKYQITERLTASSAYTFSNQNYQGNNISGGNSAQVHSISLMLTYAYPIHYQK
jgi:hypothetical protein